jgi:hypothetical protein
MGMNKSIQYAIFCENWGPGICPQGFEDFADIKSPTQYFKRKGWVRTGGDKWYCPDCAKRMGIKWGQ